MGGTLSGLIKSPLTAGGAPTSVPGMVGAVPNGSTTTAHPLLSKILKSSASGAGDAFKSSTAMPAGGSPSFASTIPAMSVDPGYFAPSNFGRSSQMSPIYGGM